MKRAAAILLSVLILSGCAAAAPAVHKTKPSAPSNSAACSGFETTSKELAATVVAGSDKIGVQAWKDALAAIPGKFDTFGLKGHGDVKDRIETLVTDLPDNLGTLYFDNDTYFEDVASVKRACSADGFDVDAYTWG